MLLSHHLIKLEDLKQMKKEMLWLKQECENLKRLWSYS
ncbi:hypothetical protein bthur0009_56340 [Bacillus thuringiensis serovar andalousiensis BGSC 4AW1]|nr:hypothetical protein bthur0009_56340 [Bacillus thuringiensis serovar andalousiensis BGSC 4AW1]